MQSITFLKSSLINEGEGKKKVRGDIIQLSPIESWPDTKMLYLFSYLPVHLSVCWASAFPPEYLSGQVFKSSGGRKIKRLSKEVRPTQQLLKIKLITGKTHQIRAHLSAYGHPIVGDGKYSNKSNKTEKYYPQYQLLHAQRIVFPTLEGDLSYLSHKEFVCEETNSFYNFRKYYFG